MTQPTPTSIPADLGFRVSPRPGTFHVETPTAVSWIGEDGICRCVYHDCVDETLESSQCNLEALRGLTRGSALPILVDLRRVRSVSIRARALWGSEQVAEVMSAGAMLIGSGVSRVLGNVMMALRPPTMPARLFTDEEAALAWLREVSA